MCTSGFGRLSCGFGFLLMLSLVDSRALQVSLSAIATIKQNSFCRSKPKANHLSGCDIIELASEFSQQDLKRNKNTILVCDPVVVWTLRIFLSLLNFALTVLALFCNRSLELKSPTTLANFVGKVVTFYHAFVFLPSPLFNVGFQWTFLLQYCLANIQH